MKRFLRGMALLAALAATAAAAAEPRGFRVEAEAGGSLERLSNGRADWRSADLSVMARNERNQSYYGRARRTERFDLRDSELQAGTYQPIGAAWGLQLEASASSTHRVLPRDSVLVQLDRRFEHGWGIQAGYRRSRYTAGGTDLVVGTLERYFSAYRAAYSVYLGRPDGAGFSPSHRLQLGYYYDAERSFVAVSVSSGREVENVPPDGLLESRVKAISLFGRHEFAPGWAIRYELYRQRQGDLYTRRGLALGIRRAF